MEQYYITGLVDGEGSFSVFFSLKRRLKTGIEVRPSFSVSLNERDIETLKKIREYFKVGGIRFSKRDRCYKYEVRSIKDLRRTIIPHFIKYPLQTSKQKDFEAFKKVCEMISKNLHRSQVYLPTIIELADTMNPSGKRRYKKEKLLKQLSK
ncbi:MAG: LAGLIDADG family homing endonuclease [bacterium]